MTRDACLETIRAQGVAAAMAGQDWQDSPYEGSFEEAPLRAWREGWFALQDYVNARLVQHDVVMLERGQLLSCFVPPDHHARLRRLLCHIRHLGVVARHAQSRAARHAGMDRLEQAALALPCTEWAHQHAPHASNHAPMTITLLEPTIEAQYDALLSPILDQLPLSHAEHPVFLDSLSQRDRHMLLLQSMHSKVCNGGFAEWACTDRLVQDGAALLLALERMARVGQPDERALAARVASLVQEALRHLQGVHDPKNLDDDELPRCTGWMSAMTR
ncbi:hypothetical protein [Deinococcus multiflagellatus]|uniref:Uncharacterized protein n=1 Tax=Deinococcus multiflagellatus TaxID=1656887 RepID=A0ABW1ZQJ9_9DEIO